MWHWLESDKLACIWEESLYFGRKEVEPPQAAKKKQEGLKKLMTEEGADKGGGGMGTEKK